jgi:hypothetical protein
MLSTTRKSSAVTIFKTNAVIAILRKSCSSCGKEKISHAEWLEKYEIHLMAAGRVLQFLGLAEPDYQSGIGWKATSRFFQMAKSAEAVDSNFDGPWITEDDGLLVNMLEGIAWDTRRLSPC